MVIRSMAQCIEIKMMFKLTFLTKMEQKVIKQDSFWLVRKFLKNGNLISKSRDTYLLFLSHKWQVPMYIRGCHAHATEIYWLIQFLEYLRTLSLKFQKAWTKIEVVVGLPCWLSKLRQPTGQSQDNFNFGPSLLKF